MIPNPVKMKLKTYPGLSPTPVKFNAVVFIFIAAFLNSAMAQTTSPIDRMILDADRARVHPDLAQGPEGISSEFIVNARAKLIEIANLSIDNVEADLVRVPDYPIAARYLEYQMADALENYFVRLATIKARVSKFNAQLKGLSALGGRPGRQDISREAIERFVQKELPALQASIQHEYEQAILGLYTLGGEVCLSWAGGFLFFNSGNYWDQCGKKTIRTNHVTAFAASRTVTGLRNISRDLQEWMRFVADLNQSIDLTAMPSTFISSKSTRTEDLPSQVFNNALTLAAGSLLDMKIKANTAYTDKEIAGFYLAKVFGEIPAGIVVGTLSVPYGFVASLFNDAESVKIMQNMRVELKLKALSNVRSTAEINNRLETLTFDYARLENLPEFVHTTGFELTSPSDSNDAKAIQYSSAQFALHYSKSRGWNPNRLAYFENFMKPFRPFKTDTTNKWHQIEGENLNGTIREMTSRSNTEIRFIFRSDKGVDYKICFVGSDFDIMSIRFSEILELIEETYNEESILRIKHNMLQMSGIEIQNKIFKR